MVKLALDGGTPVRTEPFGPRRPFGEAEIANVTEAIQSQNLFGPSGTFVPRFQERFAAMYGAAGAAACTSGTAAIHLALGALSFDPGDEIITAPITDAGSIIPILYQNLVPVFADIDETYNMDPEDVERRITGRTRAIMAIHLFGNPCDMERMAQVARRHGLILIEDCSQAHRTGYNDRLVGTFGDIGCFSLQQSKHMTTGDGGVTISANEDLVDRMRLFRDKGWMRWASRESRFYTQLGMNYRMNELSGAVACAQLDKVTQVAGRRHELGTRITAAIEGLPGVGQVPTTPGGWHTYWLYPLRVTGWPAARFAEALSAEGIPAGAGYIGEPIFMCMGSLTPGGRTFGESRHPLDGCHGGRVLEYGPGMCRRTEALLPELVTLSLHEHMTDADADDIATAIHKVAEHLPA